MPQLRADTGVETNRSVAMPGSATLRLVIGYLDKLLTDMATGTHELSASTDAMAASLIDHYAALGVPAGLSPAQAQEGIHQCQAGLNILASNPNIDISPPIAFDLQVTLASIIGDLHP